MSDKERPKNYVEHEGQRYSLHTHYSAYDGGWRRPSPDRCPATVYSPLGNGHSVSGQCSHRGKLEHEGYKFCAIHYPPNVVKREKERRAKRKAQDEARTAEWDKRDAERKLRDAALDAIRQIAAGHNDPRALALKVLGS